MASASARINLPYTPGRVWSVIGGFGSLPEWLPFILHSQLSEGGRVRHLVGPQGAAIVERLMAFDEHGRSYSYAILEAPFPVIDYSSTLRVKDVDGGSRVEWFGEFIATKVSDAEATKLFQGIYEDGLKALATHLATNAD